MFTVEDEVSKVIALLDCLIGKMSKFNKTSGKKKTILANIPKKNTYWPIF